MLNSFLNPWMLAGLAGVCLPVIAHLLSRKKYDLIEWGAMQFLELDPSAKRKIRLEELLLMLVRMGLVALVVIALARPWVGGEWLGTWASAQSRDVVLVIDGSYSMGWEGKVITPQIQALQLARQFLGNLQPGDSIQIIDAREQPQVVLPEATRDAYRAREALSDLPSPAGSADLFAAISKAVRLLSAGTNLQREVVVFTDLQALGWHEDDETLWARFDDVRSQSPIAPRIWLIDAASGEPGQAANFTIERVQLSRELAVIGAPVKISSKLKYAGGEDAIARKVYFEVDQQRLADQTVQLKLQPNGETAVEFEYRFETPGSHLVSLVLDGDALPGDNRSDAVVTVTESLPALLIDGDRKLDPTRSETFFANAAFASSGDERPWIKATVITPDELTVERLRTVSIAVVANVSRLSESALAGLQQFAASGHGVLFTLGDQVDKNYYRNSLFERGKGLLPCRFDSIGTEAGQEPRGVRIQSNSLELPWLQAFRADQGGSLGDARWSRWGKVVLEVDKSRDAEQLPDTNVNVKNDHSTPSPVSPDPRLDDRPAIIEIRLTTGDPLLVTRRYGRGVTALFTSSIDAEWNTLPAKQDYVPFLHELLFSLASPSMTRNVDVGSPLLLFVPADLNVEEFEFLNPEKKSLAAERIEDAFQPTARLRTTGVPGVYQFARKGRQPDAANRPEYFAVNFDRGESDITPLTEAQREVLSTNDRMKFIADLPELRRMMFASNTRAEFWWLLLYVFLGSLAVEAWMTRRMVRGGYATGLESSDAN